MSVLVDENTTADGPGDRYRRREPHAPLHRLWHERSRRHPPASAAASSRTASDCTTVDQAVRDAQANVSIIFVPAPVRGRRNSRSGRGRSPADCLHHRGDPGDGHGEGETALMGDTSILIGPNCPGVITPRTKTRVGIMPGDVPGPRLLLDLCEALQQPGDITAPSSECFDILSPPPGDSDVISQIDRLSSSETKIAPRSVRIAVGVRGWSATMCMVASRVRGSATSLCQSVGRYPLPMGS